MSTYWYFECVSHSPALRSDDEFTQHTEDEAWDMAVLLASQRPLEPMPEEWWYDDELWHSHYFERCARRFLEKHPACELGLLNEYGERRTVPESQHAEVLVRTEGDDMRTKDEIKADYWSDQMAAARARRVYEVGARYVTDFLVLDLAADVLRLTREVARLKKERSENA